MKFNQFLKTWAVVLVLPVFSIAVATAAVAIQDGNLSPITTDLEQSLAKQQDITQPANSSTTNGIVQPATWKRVRTRQDAFVPNVQDQDPLNPPNPGFGFPEIPQDNEDPDSAIQDNLPRIPRSNVEPEKVSAAFAGWNEASHTSANRVGETLRASWVHLDENGALNGMIQTPFAELATESYATNVFVLKDGQLIAQTQVNENGEFVIDGLKAGTYGLIAYGPDSFVAVGLNALEFRNDYRHHPRSLNLLAVPRDNFVVADFVRIYAPEVAFRNYKLYEIGEESDDPANLYGIAGLTNHEPSSIPSSSIEARRVGLKNGTMVGRLHQIDNATGRPIDVRNTTVHLTQNGETVAIARTDKYGVFEISGLTAGTYGVIAGGRDGFGAVGVELVGSGGPATTPSPADDNLDANNSTRNSARFVSNAITEYAQDADEVFDMTLVSPESIGWINHYVAEQTYLESVNSPLPQENDMYGFNQNYFGGDAMYGYENKGLFGNLFGNGGGFGSGIAFEGAAGLAFPIGLGAIISAAIDDHDGGNVIIASPSR